MIYFLFGRGARHSAPVKEVFATCENLNTDWNFQANLPSKIMCDGRDAQHHLESQAHDFDLLLRNGRDTQLLPA